MCALPVNKVARALKSSKWSTIYTRYVASSTRIISHHRLQETYTSYVIVGMGCYRPLQNIYIYIYISPLYNTINYALYEPTLPQYHSNVILKYSTGPLTRHSTSTRSGHWSKLDWSFYYWERMRSHYSILRRKCGTARHSVPLVGRVARPSPESR